MQDNVEIENNGWTRSDAGGTPHWERRLPGQLIPPGWAPLATIPWRAQDVIVEADRSGSRIVHAVVVSLCLGDGEGKKPFLYLSSATLEAVHAFLRRAGLAEYTVFRSPVGWHACATVLHFVEQPSRHGDKRMSTSTGSSPRATKSR